MHKTIPMKSISAAKLRIITELFGVQLRTSDERLAHNCGWLTSRIFQDVYCIMNIKNNFTPTYHLQLNNKFDRCKTPILAALGTYVADHPHHCYIFTDAFTYAYNRKLHTSTCVARFGVVFSKRPGPFPLTPMSSNEEHLVYFKQKWKILLWKTTKKTN